MSDESKPFPAENAEKFFFASFAVYYLIISVVYRFAISV